MSRPVMVLSVLLCVICMPRPVMSLSVLQCVICMSAKATMQTLPCGHRVLCLPCFVKTIQSAVSQRCMPLKCVICRSNVLKLKQPGNLPVRKANALLSRSIGGQAHVSKRVVRADLSDHRIRPKSTDLRFNNLHTVKSVHAVSHAKLLPSGDRQGSYDVVAPWFTRCRYNSPLAHGYSKLP